MFSFMLVHYRHRRGMYYPAPEKSLRLRRIIVWGIVAILVLYFVVPATLRSSATASSGAKLPMLEPGKKAIRRASSARSGNSKGWE